LTITAINSEDRHSKLLKQNGNRVKQEGASDKWMAALGEQEAASSAGITGFRTDPRHFVISMNANSWSTSSSPVVTQRTVKREAAVQSFEGSSAEAGRAASGGKTTYEGMNLTEGKVSSEAKKEGNKISWQDLVRMAPLLYDTNYMQSYNNYQWGNANSSGGSNWISPYRQNMSPLNLISSTMYKGLYTDTKG
jgi:hypothetical protein